LRGISAAGDREIWRLWKERFANKSNRIVGEVRENRANRHMTRAIKGDRILGDLHTATMTCGRTELNTEGNSMNPGERM
jgi:hypothetical protein